MMNRQDARDLDNHIEAPQGETWNTVEIPVNRRALEAAVAHELVKSGQPYDPALARRIINEFLTVLDINA